MDWILVSRFDKPIGAVGFIGNDAVAVAAFFDDKDANKDGDVSIGEWLVFKMSPFSMKGMNSAEVAMQARGNPMIMERDPSFRQMSAQIFVNFAQSMTIDALYKVYFARGVSAVGSGAAKLITSNMIKQMVIRKGFESAVKNAFRDTFGAAS